VPVADHFEVREAVVEHAPSGAAHPPPAQFHRRRFRPRDQAGRAGMAHSQVFCEPWQAARPSLNLGSSLAAVQNVEIERKYLVNNLENVWPSYHEVTSSDGTSIVQGYLAVTPDRSLRVRLSDNQATLTLKGPREGPTRLEFETQLPFEMGEQILPLCVPQIVSKIRYPVVENDRLWVIDVFLDQNEGLIVAEVEVDTIYDPVDPPSWCGREVTDDERYYNQYLARHPFSSWDSSDPRPNL